MCCIFRPARKWRFSPPTRMSRVEATPHHLTLSADDYARLDTNMQMNPPVRGPDHRDAIWAAANGRGRRAWFGPRATYARGEGQALSREPFGHDGRADAGAGDARPRQRRPARLRRLAISPGRRGSTASSARAASRPVRCRFHPRRHASGGRRSGNSWIASRSRWTPFDGKERDRLAGRDDRSRPRGDVGGKL